MNSHIGSSAQRQEPWVPQWIEVAERAACGGFWTWNFKTSDVYCSPTCRTMYGIPASHYVDSATWSRRIHPDDRLNMNLRAAEAQSRQEAEFRSEFRFIGPDDECRWVSSRTAITYGPDGQTESMIGFDVDITPQKHADEALERSERLVVAGRIAAMVAHEINNPLEAVTNLVYLAKADDSLERIRAYLTHAETELARVQSISRQTLSFYRQDSQTQIFEVGELLDSCLGVLNRRIGGKGVKVSVHLPAATQLCAKRGEILQVFLNLLSNSLEAVGADGHLHIHVARRGERVRIVVIDNGTGISQSHRKHLFQPFFTTKGKEGTGLGLWVSRAIVHRHKGTIRVRSNVAPGHSGTMFVISLPRGIPDAAP